MSLNLGKLAGKMKQEIDRAEEERKAQADAAARAEADRKDAAARLAKRRADAQAARKDLMGELAEFGGALGHVTVKADDEGLTLAFRGNEVRFENDGPEDRIALRLPNEVVPRNHHLARDGRAWELVLDHGTVVNRYPLEDGLEEIVRNHLRVPLPAHRIAGSVDPEEPADPPSATGDEDGPKRRGRKPRGTPGSGLQELKHPIDR